MLQGVCNGSSDSLLLWARGLVDQRVAVHGQCSSAHMGHILLVLPVLSVCSPISRVHLGGSEASQSWCSGKGSECGLLSVFQGVFFMTLECVLLRNFWHLVIIMILVRAGANIFKLVIGKNYDIL